VVNPHLPPIAGLAAALNRGRMGTFGLAPRHLRLPDSGLMRSHNRGMAEADIHAPPLPRVSSLRTVITSPFFVHSHPLRTMNFAGFPSGAGLLGQADTRMWHQRRRRCFPPFRDNSEHSHGPATRTFRLPAKFAFTSLVLQDRATKTFLKTVFGAAPRTS